LTGVDTSATVLTSTDVDAKEVPMLTTRLAEATPPRVDQLIRQADAARLARAARPTRGGARPTARLVLPAGLAVALRASLRRRTAPAPRDVCCA
jgi:hypothetical protein